MKMLRFKQGQGLSLSTVVIAALVLIVLVVLVIVFTGKIGSWSNSVDKCPDGSPGVISCNGAIPIKVLSTDEGTRYCCPEVSASSP